MLQVKLIPLSVQSLVRASALFHLFMLNFDLIRVIVFLENEIVPCFLLLIFFWVFHLDFGLFVFVSTSRSFFQLSAILKIYSKYFLYWAHPFRSGHSHSHFAHIFSWSKISAFSHFYGMLVAGGMLQRIQLSKTCLSFFLITHIIFP